MFPLFKNKNHSLTTTLIIYFLFLSAVTLFVASSLEVYFASQTQKQEAIDRQQQIAKNAAGTVQDFLHDKFSLLETAADFGSLASAGSAAQELVLNKILGREVSFRRLVILDSENKQIKEVEKFSNVGSDQFLEKIKTNVLPMGKEEKEYISPIYFDPSTGEPLVAMMVPIKDTIGDLEGRIIGEVNLKFLWDLVGGIKIGEKGTSYVVDRQGNLIAFTDISRVLARENLISLEVVKSFASGNMAPIGGISGLSKGIMGTSVVATYVALNDPDWAIITELPALEAYASTVRTIELAFISALISFLIAFGMGSFLSRRITQPIKDLRDTVEQITKGKLDTRIDLTSKDEIGNLAISFNKMTEELQLSQQTLEDKIKQRTYELNQKLEELEKMNRFMVDRELRMVELKEEIARLQGEKNKI